MWSTLYPTFISCSAPSRQEGCFANLLPNNNCGEGGIRTPGALTPTGFQDQHHKPLGHFSSCCLGGIWTHDFHVISVMLYLTELRDNIWLSWVDLNHRPLNYQFSALTNWATGQYWAHGGIRTHDCTVLQTVAFDHSTTCAYIKLSVNPKIVQ